MAGFRTVLFFGIAFLVAIIFSIREKLFFLETKMPTTILLEEKSDHRESIATSTIATTTVLNAIQEKKSSYAPKKRSRRIVTLPVFTAPVIMPPSSLTREQEKSTTTGEEFGAASSSPSSKVIPSLPALNEEALFKAVVKIECLGKGGFGGSTGSGFVLGGGRVVTAAHVVIDSGSENCTVIFSKNRTPIYYLRGTLESLTEIKRRHDQEGIDIAFITLPALASYPEARAIFSDEYPFIPYPVCGEPALLGDRLLHFGYPANYVNQNYLSRLEGVAVIYADIIGIREDLSEDQTYTYKSPILKTSNDQSYVHPYMISRVASFYGDSGGLAFDATKQCILGPHRGGTIGRAAGENYTVFPVMGWEKIKELLAK